MIAGAFGSPCYVADLYKASVFSQQEQEEERGDLTILHETVVLVERKQETRRMRR